MFSNPYVKVNRAAFRYLFAPEVEAHLDDEGTLVLGALYEEGDTKNAAGVLVRFIPEFGLELGHVAALEQKQHCMADMTIFTINAARDSYAEDTPLCITCRTDAGAATIMSFTPNTSPM